MYINVGCASRHSPEDPTGPHEDSDKDNESLGRFPSSTTSEIKLGK